MGLERLNFLEIPEYKSGRQRIGEKRRGIKHRIKRHPRIRELVANYTPVLFALIFILITIAAALTYKGWKKWTTENEGIVPCMMDSECMQGYACYYSLACFPPYDETELICDKPQGDGLCHKLCITDTDCPKGEECKEVLIFRGDVGFSYKMCIRS
ncbi:MAG: hypothetical protein QW112_00840 [Candidatus Micrarchaeia archaeon]